MDVETLIAEFEKLADCGGPGVMRSGTVRPHSISIPTVKLQPAGTEGCRRLAALGSEAMKLLGINSVGYGCDEWWHFVLDQASSLVEAESRFAATFDDEKVPLKSEKIQDAAYASAFVIRKCFIDGAVTKSTGEAEPVVEVKADPVYKPDGWTKAELHNQVNEHCPISKDTLRRTIRDAGFPPSERGGRGQQQRYGKAEVLRIIDACRNGKRRNKSEIADALQELIGT